MHAVHLNVTLTRLASIAGTELRCRQCGHRHVRQSCKSAAFSIRSAEGRAINPPEGVRSRKPSAMSASRASRQTSSLRFHRRHAWVIEIFSPGISRNSPRIRSQVRRHAHDDSRSHQGLDRRRRRPSDPRIRNPLPTKASRIGSQRLAPGQTVGPPRAQRASSPAPGRTPPSAAQLLQ